MIISGEFGQTTVPIVHDVAQINCVYILSEHKALHEEWGQEWSKVKGVFTDITSIFKALKQAAREYDQNLVSISVAKSTDGTSKENLDRLDQSFMYTQILKEILLTIDFQEENIHEFVTYCREQFVGNNVTLKNIDKFEKEYREHEPIWWYTSQSFLYSMLNRALRLIEVELIIKLGFFVRDLHNQITALHTKQYDEQHHSDSFIVYRGQDLSRADFDQLKKTPGGLMSFNNFSSTSFDRAVSLDFAKINQNNSDLIGVLFEITINPSITSYPFANVTNISRYQREKEILFSMHSVFRIGLVKQIDGNNHLWQVDLTLTSDNDPQLHAITQSIRQETCANEKAWARLDVLLIKLGQFNKAEELYQILLQKTTDESEQAYLYYALGVVKHGQGKYAEAIEF